jgi:hypothetical protein
MELRISVPDNTVIIDGVPKTMGPNDLNAMRARGETAVDWNGTTGLVMYDSSVRVGHSIKEVHELGQETIDSISRFTGIIQAWNSIPLPDPPEEGPEPDPTIWAEELADLLVQKGVITQQEIDDIIAARTP